MAGLNSLKRLITELTGLNIPINEMATMGYFNQYSVVIESEDHNPPHFHIKLNNKTVCRIQIPREYPIKTYDLVYLKNSKVHLSSKVEKELIDWLKQPEENFGKYTNLESLKYEWNVLHNKDRVVW